MGIAFNCARCEGLAPLEVGLSETRHFGRADVRSVPALVLVAVPRGLLGAGGQPFAGLQEICKEETEPLYYIVTSDYKGVPESLLTN